VGTWTGEVERANESALYERTMRLQAEDRFSREKQRLASERRMRLELQAELERVREIMAPTGK